MTATLQSAVDALNAAATAYNGKIDEINLLLDEVRNNGGVYLQLASVDANLTWVVGHSNKFILPLPSAEMTALSDNSKFDISGFYFVDDTNSSAFGCGIGVDVSINGGAYQEIIAPAHHSVHLGINADSYFTPHIMKVWDSTVSKGDEVAFRLTARFNHANARSFNGNNQINDNMGLIVREVRSNA